MGNRYEVETIDKKQAVIERFIQDEAVKVEAGNGTLTIGTVLAQKYADGKWHKYNDAATDGTENPRRMYLGDDVDTTAAAKDVVVFRAGRLNSLIVTGVTTEVKAALEKQQIWFEEVK